MVRLAWTGIAVIFFASALPGCTLDPIGRPEPRAGSTDWSSFVALGSETMAGVSDGSMVETAQAMSIPALIALQAGYPDFEQPTVAYPGLPKRIEILSYNPLTIGQPDGLPGSPTNATLTRPYNNLAVPGATVLDQLTKTAADGAAFALILRTSGSTILDQATVLRPTFVLEWVGWSDVAYSAVRGTDALLPPPSQFLLSFLSLQDSLAANRDGLRASGHPKAQVVALNIPDLTSLPFFTTVPPFVVSPFSDEPVTDGQGVPVPLLGTSGNLPSDALVTLGALPLIRVGFGIPEGLLGDLPHDGEPLPDAVVVLPSEAGGIRQAVDGYNEAIASVCAGRGIVVVDMHAVFAAMAEGGTTMGGVDLALDYVGGGVISLDGLHPTPLGYAVLANVVIGRINESFGSAIPEVNVLPMMGGNVTPLPF